MSQHLQTLRLADVFGKDVTAAFVPLLPTSITSLAITYSTSTSRGEIRSGLAEINKALDRDARPRRLPRLDHLRIAFSNARRVGGIAHSYDTTATTDRLGGMRAALMELVATCETREIEFEAFDIPWGSGGGVVQMVLE